MAAGAGRRRDQRPRQFYAGLRDELESFVKEACEWGFYGKDWISAARQRNRPLPRAPEPSPSSAHIWAWFSELALGRATGGYGICALTWHDVEAWSRRVGIDPTPAQAELLLFIDGIWRAEIHRLQELNKPQT